MMSRLILWPFELCLKSYFFVYSLFSRVADTDEDTNKSGIVEGAKGVYSSSAANIDNSGKGSYAVKAGKIPA